MRSDAPRAAMLRGRDHHRYGAVAAVCEGPAAIALSIGGARKTYAHIDPNEDAAVFALGPGGALVAVADGHDGAEGAEAAVAHLRDVAAPAWTADRPAHPPETPEAWERAALEALASANAAVLRVAEAAARPPAPTTLAFALVRPGDGIVLHASIGDSHVFLLDGRGASDVGWSQTREGRPRFLGFEPETPDALRPQCHVACRPAAGLRACVLATDGLSEHGIGVADPAAAASRAVDAAAGEAPDLRPLAACRGLAEIALDAQRRQHAGDNVATAVVWLDRAAPAQRRPPRASPRPEAGEQRRDPLRDRGRGGEAR